MKFVATFIAFIVLAFSTGVVVAEEQAALEGRIKRLGEAAREQCERLRLTKEACLERYGNAFDREKGIPIESLIELTLVGGGDSVSTEDMHNGESCPSTSATMYEPVDYSCTSVGVPGHGSQQMCCQAGCTYFCVAGEGGRTTWQSNWGSCDVDLDRCSLMGPSDKFPGPDPLDWIWP